MHKKKSTPDSLKQLVLAVRYHSGFMFAHSIQVENVKGAHPNGFEIEYSHAHTDSATRIKYNSYPRTGFSFTICELQQGFFRAGLCIIIIFLNQIIV